MDDSGSQIDLSSGGSTPRPDAYSEGRGRFLGVTFDCCGVYARIYPNAAGDAYEGRCPRCMKSVRVGIGPEGGLGRFYTAS